MPPKGSQKPKAQEQPAPKRVRKSTDAPTKKPKLVKPVTPWNTLAHDADIPIDVAYEGGSIHAKTLKNGDQGHAIKLIAPLPFTLVKSMLLTEGELEGCQAIIIRPAKAFPFMKLPKEARKQIYEYYFAPQGVLGKAIPLEGKRISTKDLFAKSYAEGSENRVALLATNKEVYAEAIQSLYDNKLLFETTTTLNDFLVQLPIENRQRLTNIAINNWVKTTSRNTMMLLSEARNIKHLYIDLNVYNEGDPGKAAKYFWGESQKFLQAIAAVKGDRAAGVNVVTFGHNALTSKDDKGKARPWGEELRDEFYEAVLGKMK